MNRPQRRKICRTRDENFAGHATHSRKFLQRSLRVLRRKRRPLNAQVDVENRASLMQIRRQNCKRRTQKEI